MKRVFCGGVLALVLLTACQNEKCFEVKGTIAQAAGEKLYLEHTALMETTVLDSCELKEDGAFCFRAAAPEYPDFYRLRIGKKSLVLAIDSTEQIQVEGILANWPYKTSVKGSEKTETIVRLREANGQVSRDSLRTLSRQVIVTNPRGLDAYYALFMRTNGAWLWNIYDAQDRRMFQAVATSFHVWMPDYERSKALYAQVSEVVEEDRNMRSSLAMQQFMEEAENAFLDITLRDEDDYLQTLSDNRGKVILLDFSLTQMERAQGYIFSLRELYNTYHSRGLEIYSVSVDPNLLAWQDAVRELPWTTVHTENGVYDTALRQYNVQHIPTLFLIDKQGVVQGRFEDFEGLDAAVRKYL